MSFPIWWLRHLPMPATMHNLPNTNTICVRAEHGGLAFYTNWPHGNDGEDKVLAKGNYFSIQRSFLFCCFLHCVSVMALQQFRATEWKWKSVVLLNQFWCLESLDWRRAWAKHSISKVYQGTRVKVSSTTFVELSLSSLLSEVVHQIYIWLKFPLGVGITFILEE